MDLSELASSLVLRQEVRSHTPNPTSTMSAAERVLNIPELLTCILYNVRSMELLQLQRVNKTWHDVVKALIKLDETLFFKAEVCDTVTKERKPEWNEFIFCSAYNLLGRKSSACCMVMPTRSLRDWKRKPGSWEEMHITKPSSRRIMVSLCNELYSFSGFELPLNNDQGVKLGDLGILWYNEAFVEGYKRRGAFLNICVKGCNASHSLSEEG